MPETIIRNRAASLTVEETEGVYNAVVATNAPCPSYAVIRGDVRQVNEVLDMSHGAADVSSFRAVLFHHDRQMVIGSIRSSELTGADLRAGFVVDDAAELPTRMSAKRAVDTGALAGVSLGFRYKSADCDYDEQTNTLTVRKWQAQELTLTATPEDSGAHVVGRSADNPIILESLKEEIMPEEIKTEEAAPVDESARAADPIAPVVPQPEPDHSMEIVRMAESNGLRASDYLGKPLADAQTAMLADLAKRTAAPAAQVSPSISVGEEECEKHRNALGDAFTARVHDQKIQDNPYAGRSIRDMAARYAHQMGCKVIDWDNKDKANYALGRMDATPNLRRAANIVTAQFPNFVFLDAISKVVAQGYEMGASDLIHPIISEINRAPDFKATRIGALGTGNLQETAENVAFPELDKSEGVFSSTAKMWGGTLSLTVQALVNDDTGQFERSLRQAGMIALKTKERRAIQKFLLGTSTATGTSTWDNNTSNGTTIVYTDADTVAAARANLYRGTVGMMNKIGGDGNPLGHMPKYLLCGPTNSIYAYGLLQTVGGQLVGNSDRGSLQVLVSPFFEASALTGNSTTTYYLLADKSVTGLVETVINGYESVQVDEYDAGAVAARNWKIWLPFEFDLFSIANSASTTIIPAAQQCTT